MPPPKHLLGQISVDMQPSESNRLIEFLKCRECSELAEDAVETLCCRALLCLKCLTDKRANQCPDCKSTCKHATSHLARRLIGTQPWRCVGCGKEGTRSDQAEHSLVCSQTERLCPTDGCEFRGFADDFLLHLTGVHKNQLLQNVEKLFRAKPKKRNRFGSNSEDSSDLGNAYAGIAMGWAHARGISEDHSRTYQTITNKNYCQQPLNGPPCDCCDGNCGPNNGCNCVDCMRLDLITFNVGSSQRTLVNREGAVSQISSETGRFYCGREVMRHDRSTDGFCGPNNGNNCHACRKLDQQVYDRYASIAAEWDEPFEIGDAPYSIDEVDGIDG